MRYGFVTNGYTTSVLAFRAREMRQSPTRSERLLWEALRRTQLGVRFRRQVVLGRFIVDFFAPSAKLAVEVDGAVHRGRVEYDALRDRALAMTGIRTMRVSAWQVEQNVDAVVERVRVALQR